ncbi:helix-turn-helix domain-containing protein [Streptomyces sp. NPDC088387]|uniref:transcriptional regulator n=1 Tax=Streptomyces sp. NPDC088387 TaxID=3365859 RepID=UPI0037F280F8
MAEGTAAAEFAALLRELKDRSGLSYGVLGKRLHLSTSTLHRYCNGDAVPADYAPVERLARLCKATPQELVELHRRWVLADARRGRKGAGGEETTLSGAGAGAGDAGDAGVSEAPPAGTAADLPGPLRPDRSRRLRRRTVVLAGVAVAVVFGAVALAVGLPGGGGGGGQDGDRRDSPVGAAASERGSASPTGHPSSGAPTRGAAPGGRSSPGAPASKTPTPASTQGGAAGDRSDTEPPLTVNTRPYTWEGPCSQRYLIDREPADVGPPPVEQDAPAWVGAYKAVSAGEQLVTLTVQGTGADTVVVDGLQVRIAGKDTPLAWNDYVMGVGCGGGVPTRPFSLALDAARPRVVAGDGQRDFPFSVSESDPEVFEIYADASAYDVSWYLELTWSSGDRKGTVVVDDNGRPFRTSGENGRPLYEFPLGGEKWLKSSGEGR